MPTVEDLQELEEENERLKKSLAFHKYVTDTLMELVQECFKYADEMGE